MRKWVRDLRRVPHGEWYPSMLGGRDASVEDRGAVKIKISRFRAQRNEQKMKRTRKSGLNVLTRWSQQGPSHQKSKRELRRTRTSEMPNPAEHHESGSLAVGRISGPDPAASWEATCLILTPGSHSIDLITHHFAPPFAHRPSSSPLRPPPLVLPLPILHSLQAPTLKRRNARNGSSYPEASARRTLSSQRRCLRSGSIKISRLPMTTSVIS